MGKEIPNQLPPVNSGLPTAPNSQTQSTQDRTYFAKTHSISPPWEKWANSSTALKIRSFIYRTLSLVSKPFNSSTSDYYYFRMKRVDIKLMNIYDEKHLESIILEHRLPGGINMVQKSAAENQAEMVQKKQELSKELLKSVQKNHPGSQLKAAPARELFTEGICFGIVVDLSDNYLNKDKEKMEQLFSELNMGGSAEAEIYQGGVRGVNPSPTKGFILENFYTSILAMKSDATGSSQSKLLPHVDSNHQSFMRSTIFNLQYLDSNPPNFLESVRNNQSYSNLLFPLNEEEEANYMIALQKSKSEVQSIGLAYLVAKAFESIKNDNRSNRTEMHNGKDILDFSYAQGKVLQELDIIFNKKMEEHPEQKSFLIKRREQLVGEIKLAAAAGEYVATGAITTDPLLSAVFEHNNSRIGQEAMFNYKGLSLTPCLETMGRHVQYSDDKSYLENLSKLDPGFYWLSIRTQGGAHAVSLIIEADGSGYLIDPNDMKLKFSNVKEATELANLLTSRYSEPGVAIPGRPYHKLELFKIEKK